jgi:hypothetical protein
MRFVASVLLLSTLLAEPIRAACCSIVKLDTTAPTVAVRVCEPDAAGACGLLLFEGLLSVGQSQSVCADSGTVIYQERLPDAADYEPPVSAVCEAVDVEI